MKPNGTGRTRPIVIAYDPGKVTGFAAWGPEGLVVSGQGDAETVLLETLPLLRVSPVVYAVIEKAFLGKGTAASLATADAGGFLAGALWASGVRCPVWRPIASQWRAELGFEPWMDLPKEGRRRKKRDDFEEDARAFAAGHTDRGFTKSRTHEAEAICMASAGWEKWIEKQPSAHG
jgi:hypothetical protein